jgi:hypothetical protein
MRLFSRNCVVPAATISYISGGGNSNSSVDVSGITGSNIKSSSGKRNKFVPVLN